MIYCVRTERELTKYIYNARDIAAYITYFSVPQYMEVSYMQYIFNIGTPVIAAPLCRDFLYYNETGRKAALSFGSVRL